MTAESEVALQVIAEKLIVTERGLLKCNGSGGNDRLLQRMAVLEDFYETVKTINGVAKIVAKDREM